MEIAKLLKEFKEKGIPKDLIDRNIKINWIDNKANIVAGMRRVGKTYSVFQVLRGFNFNEVYYLNMEDDRIINPNLSHLSEIIPVIKENFEVSKNKKIYVFVDEIQNINGWEKWARRIAEFSEVVLFISGSSSKLSSYEIATSLRGRTLTNYVFPLSFLEFLKFKKSKFDLKNIGFSSKKPEFLKLFNEYLDYGGFPEVVLISNKSTKIKILQEYFSTIIAKDIIERYNIDNILALETLMKYLVNNHSRLISFSKIQKWMKSMGIKVGKATLLEYFNYIKQSYFVYSVPIFSYKIKDVLQYPTKVYISDNGFVNSLLLGQKNIGLIYEQTVANELFKKSMENLSFGIHYWQNEKREEVDFVIKKGIRVYKLIQVCYDIENLDTKEREIRALLKGSKELKCNNLIVINKDYEDEKEEEWFGIKRRVKYIPLWKWLVNF